MFSLNFVRVQFDVLYNSIFFGEKIEKWVIDLKDSVSVQREELEEVKTKIEKYPVLD